VLWPAHFDVAIRVHDMNFGVSPGDEFIEEPYAYVGVASAPAGDSFWNAPFGAALPLRDLPDRCLIHGHCHQKALTGVQGTAALLRRIPELDVRVLDTGCCGMAGSFGYEKAHYDVSVAIAQLDLLPALDADPQALVVAPGTSCRHQIKDLTPRRALHPLEVVANRLPG